MNDKTDNSYQASAQPIKSRQCCDFIIPLENKNSINKKFYDKEYLLEIFYVSVIAKAILLGLRHMEYLVHVGLAHMLINFVQDQKVYLKV